MFTLVVLDRDELNTQEAALSVHCVPLTKDDKSQFLAQVGYTTSNWQQLERDLREQILSLEAMPTVKTQYGQKYAITGELRSPNGITIRVKTIWINTGDVTQFVTLFPA